MLINNNNEVKHPMNRVIGYLTLHNRIISLDKLTACAFKTPYWQPDHEGYYKDKMMMLSATQRFITPECADCLMPYQDTSSSLIINADAYLTNRKALYDLLSVDASLADAKLILLAYLKWGEDCTRFLAGQFCFAIWNPQKQELFAAVDHFSSIPFFYSYRPHHAFIFSNEFSPFHQLLPRATIRQAHFLEFACDIFSLTKTSYEEVFKLPPGHQLIVNQQGMKQSCFWRLQDQKEKSLHQTREEYYATFRELFEQAVQTCLRSTGPTVSQISGGLDSSAVTAQAASLLKQQQKILHGMTAIPKGLNGPSYRKNWYYHEMPRVQKLLEKYPNIRHFSYIASPELDIFRQLKKIHRYLDQPIRNVQNFDWIIGSYDYARSIGARTVLNGQTGNASISWTGSFLVDKLRTCYHALKIILTPYNLYDGFFNMLNPSFLNSAQAKHLLCRHHINLSSHLNLLSGLFSAPLMATAYITQLWYGIRFLDPTRDLAITKFCYNIPQHIYCKGKNTKERRLLIREGLRDFLPDEIALNPYRGEQAADAYLQYNVHKTTWKNSLQHLKNEAKEILWKSYSYKNIMDFFNEYPSIHVIVDKSQFAKYANLMRCMSMGFYLNDLFQ